MCISCCEKITIYNISVCQKRVARSGILLLQRQNKIIHRYVIWEAQLAGKMYRTHEVVYLLFFPQWLFSKDLLDYHLKHLCTLRQLKKKTYKMRREEEVFKTMTCSCDLARSLVLLLCSWGSLTNEIFSSMISKWHASFYRTNFFRK